MSTGSIEAIVNGVVDLAAISACTACFFRVAGRLQVARAGAPQAAAQPSPERPAPVPFGAISARPADRAAREADFAKFRTEGKTVAEAGELVRIKPRTARTYETNRLAKQNGAKS